MAFILEMLFSMSLAMSVLNAPIFVIETDAAMDDPVVSLLPLNKVFTMRMAQ